MQICCIPMDRSSAPLLVLVNAWDRSLIVVNPTLACLAEYRSHVYAVNDVNKILHYFEKDSILTTHMFAEIIGMFG